MASLSKDLSIDCFIKNRSVRVPANDSSGSRRRRPIIKVRSRAKAIISFLSFSLFLSFFLSFSFSSEIDHRTPSAVPVVFFFSFLFFYSLFFSFFFFAWVWFDFFFFVWFFPPGSPSPLSGNGPGPHRLWTPNPTPPLNSPPPRINDSRPHSINSRERG